VKFILCTTEPHKVPQTIQSRCQRFDFRNIPTKQIAGHLGAVAKGEGIEVTEDVLLAVARLANGSMRDGLSLLDRLLAAATGKVDAAVLEQVFGLPDDEILLDIVDACVCERVADALLHGARLLERGSGVEQALELLAERFRWILVASAAGTESDLLEVAASMRDRVARIAGQTDAAFASHAIALCDATARNARGSSAPRALYDACLARLALSTRFASGAALLAGGGGDSKKAGNPAAPRATGASPAVFAVEPKPAAAPTVVAPPVAAPPSSAPAVAAPAANLAELRLRLEQVAERSPRERALVDQIEVLDFAGDSARVALVDNGSGQYLVTNPDPIRTLISRAAGRPVRITLDTSRLRKEADAPRPVQVDDPSVRNDPLVRKAAELFDASVIAVTPRFASDAEKPVENVETKSGDEAVSGAVPSDDPVSFDTMDEPFE
jgi:DNA polymerase III gamma/tau subunit